MLSPEIIKAYNAVRTTPDKSVLCHAPFTNLNFEQNGNVTACCYNRTHVLGTYPQDDLFDIWYGQKADELRTYIKQNSLEGGCSLCDYQIRSGNFLNSRAKGFDPAADYKLTQYIKKAQSFVKRGKTMQMPISMEFELSNTCNLECVMCNGYFSSSIRKNREKASPMPNPYDDAFVEQLIPFIPYLKDAKFLGGEPFLIDIYYKIWEAFAKYNPNTRIHITTNATVLNQKAKNLLEKLNCTIIFSIDSIVKETYENIRLNAKFERVWENFEYFYDYTRRKGTQMSFAICPITLNWHEMPDIVRFCNEKDIVVFFNTVVKPQQYTLDYLPADELEKIVAFYNEANLLENTATEKFNKGMFLDMVKLITAWYERTRAIENDVNDRDKRVREIIGQAVAEQIILPEHQNEHTLGVVYELLIYLTGFPYADDDKGKEANTIAVKKLFDNLGRLSEQTNANTHLTAIFAAYRYLPVLNKSVSVMANHPSKMDELMAEVATIKNAEWIARDMNSAEPFQVINHMNGHTAQQLIEGIYQRYH